MSKIQLPPKRTEEKKTIKKTLNRIREQKILEVINKGGSPAHVSSYQDDKVKNFNIKILASDLSLIGSLCKRRPKRLGRTLSFAKQDWIMEAIQEKIERERRKYNVLD